jgi:tetratricopeptide (TPR) repeat protein
MPRHQTLRAVVDWSWDLLDDAERTLWRRFSVFTGGATLEAAEQVCSGSGLPADRVLDLLTALAEKSLLTVRHDPPRYWMLEIIRAYGQERLAEAGEQDEVREAHAQYFTRLAEASQEHLLRAEQLDWLRKLSADQDNLHAAIRGAVAAGDGPAAVRLAAALGWYWFLRSMKVEGAELIAEALSARGGDPPEPPAPGATHPPGPPLEHLAVACAMGALLAIDTPLRATGLQWLDRAAALAARIPDPVNPVMPLLGPLAALFGAPDPVSGSGQRPVGPDVFDDAVGDPHPWVAAIARILRGHWALNLGQRHTQAEADFLAGASILAELGERFGQAVALSGLAMLEGWRGEHATAVGHYRQARELVEAFGSTEDEVQFRLFMVRQLWLAGEPEAAWDELSRAQPDAERLGLPELRAFAVYVAGDLARLDGRPEAAREALVRAVRMAIPPDVAQQVRAVAATGLGYLAGAEGDLDAARDWHAQALADARSAADAPVIAEALTGLADLALRENDQERAAELLGASVAIRGTTDRSVHDEKRVADQARSVLGGTRYGQAYQRGQRVTMDTLAALVNLTPGA